MRGFLLPSTARNPFQKDSEPQGEETGGGGHLLVQFFAHLPMNKSVFGNHAASTPGSLPLHTHVCSSFVGSISSGITSFLCGYREFSPHNQLGEMVLVRGTQEAGVKAILSLTRSSVHRYCLSKNENPSLPEAGCLVTVQAGGACIPSWLGHWALKL